MSYSDDSLDRSRRVADYVNRILQGTKPAELPVEQPKKFDFIINLKGAEADRPDDPAECAGASGQGDQVILSSKAASRE